MKAQARSDLLRTLKARFEKHMHRHEAVAWADVLARLEARPDEPVPAGVDYNLWLGPAPERPFNQNRFHGGWHWHWEYGTGDIGNDGVHQIDLGRWALGLKAPRAVSCSAAKLGSRGDAPRDSRARNSATCSNAASQSVADSPARRCCSSKASPAIFLARSREKSLSPPCRSN